MYNSDCNKRTHTLYLALALAFSPSLSHSLSLPTLSLSPRSLSQWKKHRSTNSNKMMNVFIARYCYVLTNSRMHAHKMAFTWILYVLHYMYFNQFHFPFSNLFSRPSCGQYCTHMFIESTKFWKEAIGMFNIIYVREHLCMNIIMCYNVCTFPPKKPLMMKHILVVLIDFASISVILNSRICYYSYIHLLNLHYISLYFSMENPTKCLMHT